MDAVYLQFTNFAPRRGIYPHTSGSALRSRDGRGGDRRLSFDSTILEFIMAAFLLLTNTEYSPTFTYIQAIPSLEYGSQEERIEDSKEN